MTSIDAQRPQYFEGCGARLRTAREAAGLSLEQVGSRLKMPVRVLQSLEEEDWSRLGAAVYVRGQLRSYGRLLGVDVDPTMTSSGIPRIEPPVLVSHMHTSPVQRLLEQAGRRLVYVVMTALIVVPVWMMATRGSITTPAPQQTTPLDAPSVGTTGKSPPVVPVERSTVTASMTSMPPGPASAAALSIRFKSDSWIEVTGADGAMLEKGLVAMGTQRDYAAGQVTRIVVGNATAVEVLRAGHAVDLAPFRRANVARFTVSSDGSLAPSAD